jgi:hypothetical protein
MSVTRAQNPGKSEAVLSLAIKFLLYFASRLAHAPLPISLAKFPFH